MSTAQEVRQGWQIEARVACMHLDHDDVFVSDVKIYLDKDFAIQDMQYGHGELFSVSLSEDTGQGWPCDDAWVDDIYLEEVEL